MPGAGLDVLHVAAELFPFLKTGGLADVAAALPPALCRLGCDARLLLPGFPALLQALQEKTTVAELPPSFGAGTPRLLGGTLGGMRAYLIEAPDLYDRPGNPYADANNYPYADNHRRFALLGWMAARLAEGIDPGWRPQLIHGHDWHAGLAPAYLRATGVPSAPSVMTIHNLAYQGTFAPQSFDELDLPRAFFDMHGVEFHGQVSFLKAGLFYADRITTVSPSYAREIQEPEQGYGLDGLLRDRAHELVGILNGTDASVWNPATDPLIAARYKPTALQGKLSCKRALQEELGLETRDDALLFCVVSRLTEQKGLNLVLDGLQEIINRGGQLALLGSGDAWLEHAFRSAAERYPQSVAVRIGYDEALSHRLIAGSDVILVPSRYEPCGLTQLYGLLYGTLPLVRRVGGLADTVVDCSLENLADETATGFVFERFGLDAFSAALRRAFALYGRTSEWRRVQRQAMRQEFGWDAAARKLLAVYSEIKK